MEQLEFPFDDYFYDEYFESLVAEFDYYVRTPEDLDCWLEDHELTSERSSGGSQDF
jgi:hypothetical protein